MKRNRIVQIVCTHFKSQPLWFLLFGECDIKTGTSIYTRYIAFLLLFLLKCLWFIFNVFHRFTQSSGGVTQGLSTSEVNPVLGCLHTFIFLAWWCTHCLPNPIHGNLNEVFIQYMALLYILFSVNTIFIQALNCQVFFFLILHFFFFCFLSVSSSYCQDVKALIQKSSKKGIQFFLKALH